MQSHNKYGFYYYEKILDTSRIDLVIHHNSCCEAQQNCNTQAMRLTDFMQITKNLHKSVAVYSNRLKHGLLIK